MPNDMDLIGKWYQAKQALATAREAEAKLRKQVVKNEFGELREGINSIDLPDGYRLKVQHSISRIVDEGELIALTKDMESRDISVDELIRWKASLNLPAYRTYKEAEPDKAKFFEQVLIIKPGFPQLAIDQPKSRKK